MTFNETSYKRNCKKYTKATTDLYVQRVRDAAGAGMLKRKPKDAMLTASVWMSRDEQSGKITTAPGYGVPKRPAAPTLCYGLVQSDDEEMATTCRGKVKSTHDEALCMSCGKQWRLLNDLWVEVSDE